MLISVIDLSVAVNQGRNLEKYPNAIIGLKQIYSSCTSSVLILMIKALRPARRGHLGIRPMDLSSVKLCDSTIGYNVFI